MTEHFPAQSPVNNFLMFMTIHINAGISQTAIKTPFAFAHSAIYLVAPMRRSVITAQPGHALNISEIC